MNFVKTLSRDEMKHVMAGTGECRIAMRYSSDGSWYGWSDCMSYGNAIFYNDDVEEEGDRGWLFAGGDIYTSGYCCESCGQGGNTAPDC